MKKLLPDRLHYYSVNSLQGFTLVEVLVAAVILFASISTVSLVYRGAFISSEKASEHVKVAGVLPSVLANIRDIIRMQGDVQQAQINQSDSVWGVSYKWQANLLEQKGAPEKLDVDTGDYITPPAKYKLWLVILDVKYQNYTNQYQFHEVSWTGE